MNDDIEYFMMEDRYREESKKPRITLAYKIDNLKSNWWLWAAERENEDGTITDGVVQSDGHMIAEETFEPS